MSEALSVEYIYNRINTQRNKKTHINAPYYTHTFNTCRHIHILNNT